MCDQDRIFFEREGDEWYGRNRSVLRNPDYLSIDIPLFVMGKFGIVPRRALEIGCSNGWRLSEITKRFSCECHGVEPSEKAVKEGTELYPGITLRRGLASALPYQEGEKFDVVIVSYVLHWVSRNSLWRSLAEIDRVVADGGYVILCDFLPDFPSRRRYHHVSESDVFTYKFDYSKIFLSTPHYTEVFRLIYDHDDRCEIKADVPALRRGFCSVLKKSEAGCYIEQGAPEDAVVQR